MFGLIFALGVIAINCMLFAILLAIKELTSVVRELKDSSNQEEQPTKGGG